MKNYRLKFSLVKGPSSASYRLLVVQALSMGEAITTGRKIAEDSHGIWLFAGAEVA